MATLISYPNISWLLSSDDTDAFVRRNPQTLPLLQLRKGTYICARKEGIYQLTADTSLNITRQVTLLSLSEFFACQDPASAIKAYSDGLSSLKRKLFSKNINYSSAQENIIMIQARDRQPPMDKPLESASASGLLVWRHLAWAGFMNSIAILCQLAGDRQIEPTFLLNSAKYLLMAISVAARTSEKIPLDMQRREFVEIASFIAGTQMRIASESFFYSQRISDATMALYRDMDNFPIDIAVEHWNRLVITVSDTAGARIIQFADDLTSRIARLVLYRLTVDNIEERTPAICAKFSSIYEQKNSTSGGMWLDLLAVNNLPLALPKLSVERTGQVLSLLDFAVPVIRKFLHVASQSQVMKGAVAKMAIALYLIMLAGPDIDDVQRIIPQYATFFSRTDGRFVDDLNAAVMQHDAEKWEQLKTSSAARVMDIDLLRLLQALPLPEKPGELPEQAEIRRVFEEHEANDLMYEQDQEEENQELPTTYIVSPGDTLKKISQRFYQTYIYDERIRAVNQLGAGEPNEGRLLLIPKPHSCWEQPIQQYTVGPDEHAYQIAQKLYGTGRYYFAIDVVNEVDDPEWYTEGRIIHVPDIGQQYSYNLTELRQNK